MTVWTRAAALVALTLSTGMLAMSTPGSAAEIALAISAPAIQAPAVLVEVDNTPTPISVPQLPIDDAVSVPDAIEYATLADSVAAQDAAGADETLRCLAGAIYHEAKGEPLAGQLAVAEVILNRAKSGRFPTDACAVVRQRGQFSFVRGGAIPLVDSGHSAWKRAVAVAKVAVGDVWNSPASGALYFNAARRSPAARTVRVASIGNHVFWR